MKIIAIILLLATTVLASDKIEVRLYTNWHCKPCKMMMPYVEPVLKELVDSKKIYLVKVDSYFLPNDPLLKEDRIERTPSCVIIKNGYKMKYIGSKDVFEALLKLTCGNNN